MKRKFESLQLKFNGEDEEADFPNRELPWKRGRFLGKGGFGSVYLANSKTPNSNLPEKMAIKSAEISESISLQKEKEILEELRNCPYIINCYGQQTTTHNGHKIYNLLLEYAAGGTLSDRIKNSRGRGLPEPDVKRYTRSILKGIEYIHSHGYVHCDLKPENVLLVASATGDSFVPVIGDFGLAKNRKKAVSGTSIGGTALYMAPETVTNRTQDRPSDIWAIGCIVLEMLTGKKAWDWKPGTTTDEIFRKIRESSELPEIPGEISEEAKCFLRSCLVRAPMLRNTVGQLLKHRFVSGFDDVEISGGRLSCCDGCELPVSEDWSFFSDSSSSDSWSLGDSVEVKRMFDGKLVGLVRPGIVV